MDVKKINNTPDSKINSQGVKMNSKKSVTIAEKVENALGNLFKRAEREVPENMDFSPVKELIESESGQYIVKIIADPVNIKNSRRIVLSTGLSDSDYSLSVALAKGSKSEILETLSNKNFSNVVIDNIRHLKEELKYK